ncbi:protein of unknown function DUF4205 [Trinorchestia longiramus]|nr:protein of unknown function DUF4205 [Trinorchestia longiramus]
MSARGKSMSARGKSMSARGKSMSARGKSMSARGKSRSARGRSVSAGGKPAVRAFKAWLCLVSSQVCAVAWLCLDSSQVCAVAWLCLVSSQVCAVAWLCLVSSQGATKGSPCLGGGDGGSEPLISGEEGHGEQSLLNLLITGTPSSHVFDGANDLGGMKLLGVWRRPSVGLLHLQEHYRQLRVGWYLKNPLHPVWLCASQHHITVVFSLQRELVCPASEIERGHQVFSWYDTEGNGFIQQSQLMPVLQHLGLCTDEQFVKFMCEELDPDNMGVILYHKFQDAFFSGEQLHTAPDTFTLFHYNGLPASNPEKKVQYAKGFVTRQESHVQFSSVQDLTACLSTKWPNIELQWEDNFKPSMN